MYVLEIEFGCGRRNEKDGEVSNVGSSFVQMSSRIAQKLKLPRLTLFTGGPECSLCEVAKQDLKQVQQIVRTLLPSHLSLLSF